MKWRSAGLVLVLAAGPLVAQPVVFRPTEHLPGYTEAEFSPDRDLYDFRPFEAVRGAKVTPEQLADLRKRWKAEQTRVAAELEAVKTDPLALYAHQQRKWVLRHPFFKDLEFDRIKSHRPFVFFVQRIANRPPAELVDALGPVLQAVLTDFRRNLSPALELEAPETEEGHTVVLLGDQATFQKYAELFEGWASIDRCLYNVRTRSMVGWASGGTDPMLAGDAAFALAQGLLHRSGLDFEKEFRPLWALWGLPGYLCAGERLAGARALYGKHLDDLVLARETQPIYCAGLELLFRARNRTEIVEGLSARSGIPGPDKATRDSAVRVFYAQTTQLARYLLASEDARVRSALRAAWRAVVAGHDPAEGFGIAYGTGWQELETGFWEFVVEERTRVAEADPGRPPAKALAVPNGTRAGAPAPAAPAPPTLQLQGSEWRALVGLAWHEVAAGRFAEAVEVLRVAPPPADPAAAERLRRETRRVEASIALRDDLFRDALANRSLLRFKIDGRLVQGHVERFADGAVTVRSRSGRMVTELSLSEVPVDQLVEQAETLGKTTGDAALTAGWLAALGGAATEDVERHMARAGDAAERLRAELGEREELARLAGAARLLMRLVECMGDPSKGAAGAELLAQLLPEHRDSPLVATRLDALRIAAESLLTAAFDPLLPECSGVRRTPEKLADGRAKWHYDFIENTQIGDFRVDAHYLADTLADWFESLERQFGALETEAEGSFRVEEAALRCVGRSALRWPMAVRAPFSVRYRVSFDGEGLLLVGVADNGKGDFIGCQYVGDLILRDTPSGLFEQADRKDPEFYLDRDYDVELRNDGTGLVCLLDGKEVSSFKQVGTRVSGSLFFWVYSKNEIRVRGLQVIGMPHADGMKRLRELWVHERMRELFGMQ